MSETLKRFVRDVPDFPRPGILFKDITPLLQDAGAFRSALDGLEEAARRYEPDVMIGIESRGFIFAAPLALRLGCSFVPVRKLGKLPYERLREDYELEYGAASLEMHSDAVLPGQRAVILDDLLATGGTAAAAGRLLTRAGGRIAAYGFVIELAFLNGRQALSDAPVFTLLQY